MRRSGILLPISSLPSEYGIGTFSKEAYEFVDFLAAAGQSLWQILPLGPTGYGDSPYQSFSTFAGNPYFIDLEALIEEGYLTKKECDACDFGSGPESIDYGKLYAARFPLLRKAYGRAMEKHLDETRAYREFMADNALWLKDYALYMAVKDGFGGAGWDEWEEDIRLRSHAAMERYREKYADEIGFYEFQQYVFAKQWHALKKYANAKGIQIVGDIPIYVSFDSADTWANPELFQLDEECRPIAVAGCPPDAFAKTGQLWGNPLYDWEFHKDTGYDWWIRRINYSLALYDIVRIDHFRGFDAYWSVPFGEKTAVNGKWCKGPGHAVFERLKKTTGPRRIIAEDLGFLTPSVNRLVRKTGFPGMKVLQFAFDGDADSTYLPHNYQKNCVVYTGTHDNDTTKSWYAALSEKSRKYADEYLQIPAGEKQVEWRFIRAALASVADTAIIPMQDYLGLPGSARINVPSTLGDNWKWRMKKRACSKTLSRKIKKICAQYGRCPVPAKTPKS